MQQTQLLLTLLWIAGAYASHGRSQAPASLRDERSTAIDDAVAQRTPRRDPRAQGNSRDTYPINCHLHDWPPAAVASVREAYAWFYELWAPLEADAQRCRRAACFGRSAVWLAW
ncbi:hypothetical protein SAMD00023353_4400670 [Rosellinia necatrix]|uniref:Uncharacterized protein n=1 Tax=Rosellinia necatrix TaxID=77044 RepID=A0A1W2TNK8_ROSNE|nr:hypothetical protein SAMD00023353_4400670 [Rosellinia necatrix]